MNKITKKRPNSIVINGYGKNVVNKTDNLIYNMSIMIKDGKVRINVPTFSTHPERLKDKIFRKDWKVSDQKIKKQIEDFFNAIISNIDNILLA
jgi:basic membrane lipoprotein Med (substrate-binding protein (PBP1-ABC) superfamily)